MAAIRKIIAHTIHAQGSGASYADIFSSLAGLDAGDRVVRLEHDVVGIPNIWEVDGGYLLQFAEGTPGVSPFVLDAASGATRVEALRRNEVLSDVSHALVYPRRRQAAIEYVRRGAKAAVMGATIEGILRTQDPAMKTLRVEFSPPIREDFVKEIDRFKRIRVTEIVVTRPNAGWSDHYDELSDLLDKSDGDSAHVDVRAARGGTLATDSGIVQVVKKITEEGAPYLKDARITGSRPDDAAETTVSLKSYLEHTRARVATDENGQVDPQTLGERMRAFIRQLTQRQ